MTTATAHTANLQPAVADAIELACSGMSVTDAVDCMRVRFALKPTSNVAHVVASIRRSRDLIADALLKLGDARRILAGIGGGR